MNTQQDIRFLHFNQPDKFPFHGTIGFRIAPQGEGRTQVTAAVACVSPRDQFCRRIGRQVVRGRMECDRDDIKHVEEFVLPVPVPQTKDQMRDVERMVVERVTGLQYKA